MNQDLIGLLLDVAVLALLVFVILSGEWLVFWLG